MQSFGLSHFVLYVVSVKEYTLLNYTIFSPLCHSLWSVSVHDNTFYCLCLWHRELAICVVYDNTLLVILFMFTVGWFTEAALHKWMPFVIFHARSRERSQLPLPGRFLSRHWFTLCTTMEVEPRLVKQLKMSLLLLLQKLQGKDDEGWKKVSLHHVSVWKPDQNTRDVNKKAVSIRWY